MCRFAGLVGAHAAPGQVEAALHAQAHGGPDDRSSYKDPLHPVTLCHNRLSVVDTSQAGRQPMTLPGADAVLVFNGELYNYNEIKKQIPARNWQSATDSEVLLAAYMEYGAQSVAYFNGMFSFAIWDRRRRVLVCGRDRLGIKPFHYAVHRGAFYFSSEIKGMAALGLPLGPDMKTWSEYVVHGCSDHGSRTFFEGVRSLPPGHTLVLDLSRPADPQIERYWNLPSLARDTACISLQEAQRTLVELIDDAVRLRLHADVPVGLNLSGGLDSASLLASADRQWTGGSVSTFTTTFGDPEYDESEFAAQVPVQANWQRHFARLEPEDVVALADTAIWHQEAPFGGVATLAYHRLHEAANEAGVVVLLEGQGVDELLAGYRYFLPYRLWDLLETGRLRRLRREIACAADERLRLARELRRLANGGPAATVSQDGTTHLRPRCASRAALELAGAPPVFDQPFPDRLRNVLHRDLAHTKLPRVLRMNDRLSMASARELRVPFLDHRVVEFAFALPGSFKVRDGATKYLLREAMADRLPDAVRKTPKRAVVTPQREWLAGPLAPFVEEIVNSEAFGRRGLFRQAEVVKEFARFRMEGSANSFHVWQWVVAELWFRRFAT